MDAVVYDSITISESVTLVELTTSRGTNLREVETLVTELLQEDAKLIKPDMRTRAITASVNKFSKDKPNRVTNDISADSGYVYDLPTTFGKAWVDGFSYIISIEYPADKQDPVFVDPIDYQVYDDGTINKLRFPATTPQSGYIIRLKHTTTWILTNTSSTIEDRDAHPLACLAASICLRMLASYFLQTSKPSLDIDVIDYNRKSIEATTLADGLENLYRDHVGIIRIGAKSVEAPVTAATGAKDLDIQFPWGEDYITHPKRQR